MFRSAIFFSSVAVAYGLNMHGYRADLVEVHPPQSGAHGNRTSFSLASASLGHHANEWLCDAEVLDGQHAKFVTCSDDQRDDDDHANLIASHRSRADEDHPRAHGNRTLFILGSSVDRYATEWFCDAEEPNGTHAKFVACSDERRDLAVAYLFHPGVGFNGDLQPPFYNYTRYKTINVSSVFESAHFVHEMLGTKNPELVIVESSLWDLAVWRSLSRVNTSPDRVQKWCDSDLPNLLSTVKRIFPNSKVVFRTAPTIGSSSLVPGLDNVTAYSPDEVELLYGCIASHLQKHKHTKRLFGMYEFIDYHRIMEDLIIERGGRISSGNLWLKDGFHPNREPARRYFNEILKFMNLPPVEKENWPADIVPNHQAGWQYELSHPK